MSIFRVHVTRWLLDGRQVKAKTPGAAKVRSRSRKWYGRLPGGKRIPLSTNKAVSLSMFAEVVKKAERIRGGWHDPSEDHASTPLARHLAAFEAVMKAGKATRSKPPLGWVVERDVRRIRRVLAGCEFVFAADLDAATVQDFLAGLTIGRKIDVPRRDAFTMAEVCELLSIAENTVGARCYRMGLPRVGNGPATSYPRDTVLALSECQTRGMAQGTVATYAKLLRRFTRWLAKEGRIRFDPFASLEVACPEHDNRHQRRALSAEEMERFLSTTRASKRKYRKLSGRDRWALYLTALSTGFRCKEVASLTPSRFILDGSPPLVMLAESESKNDKGASQPLPVAVVQPLREYLAGRSTCSPVWPGTWHVTSAEMLRRDLWEVGIPYRVDGPDGPLFLDFHALRHSFVAMLKRAGVTLSQAMRLARHSDPRLTLRVYGREDLAELSDAVGKIQPGKLHQ